MPHVLKKIDPLFVHVDVPKNDDGTVCKLVGTTDDNRPIYKKHIVRATPHVAKLDENGKEEYGRNPITGERVYRKYTRGPLAITLFVVPNNQGNGNLTWDEHFFPSEEELRARARREQIELTKDELATALVDGGINVADLINAVRAGRLVAPERPDRVVEQVAAPTTSEAASVTASAPVGAEEFPKAHGIGKWLLSDGSEVKGKKVDAIAAQQALATAAGAALDSIPES